MKFEYQYRTTDNVRHSGIIAASNRDAAFAALKEKGIHPSRLVDAPGFLNRLFGRGKRWLAIAVLAALCLSLISFFIERIGADRRAARAEYESLFEDRAQLFGDPAVIQKLTRNGWRETFSDPGEAWLARHAIPGKVCECNLTHTARTALAAALLARKDIPLTLSDADGDELRKMKRMVNGMKREFAAYVAPQPPNAQTSKLPNYQTSDLSREYISKACERMRIEKGVSDRIAQELAALERDLSKKGIDRAKILSIWEQKNKTLRSMGLPAILLPEPQPLPPSSVPVCPPPLRK